MAPNLFNRLSIKSKVIQAVITSVVTIGSAIFLFYQNVEIERQKQGYAIELKILEDSLSKAGQRELEESMAIAALKIDVKIAETLYEVLQKTDASYAHYIKVHNGGLELSPTRQKYTTILSEVTQAGVNDIQEYYQKRPLNVAALNSYANALPSGTYSIDNHNDPVFKNDTEAIQRLKAININSIIIYYIGHINQELLFIQLSFDFEDASKKKSGTIYNYGLDYASQIRSMIKDHNDNYKKISK